MGPGSSTETRGAVAGRGSASAPERAATTPRSGERFAASRSGLNQGSCEAAGRGPSERARVPLRPAPRPRAIAEIGVEFHQTAERFDRMRAVGIFREVSLEGARRLALGARERKRAAEQERRARRVLRSGRRLRNERRTRTFRLESPPSRATSARSESAPASSSLSKRSTPVRASRRERLRVAARAEVSSPFGRPEAVGPPSRRPRSLRADSELTAGALRAIEPRLYSRGYTERARTRLCVPPRRGLPRHPRVSRRR